MSKKLRIIISILVAVVVLVIGGAITVMAQDDGLDEDSAATTEADQEGLLDRVAVILGIPREDLVNAFQQAADEMHQEATERALARAVENGIIDEDEAAAISEWLAEKPEALDKFQPKRARISGMFRGRIIRGCGEGWFGFAAPDNTE